VVLVLSWSTKTLLQKPIYVSLFLAKVLLFPILLIVDVGLVVLILTTILIINKISIINYLLTDWLFLSFCSLIDILGSIYLVYVNINLIYWVVNGRPMISQSK
jgi:hypothetical protein